MSALQGDWPLLLQGWELGIRADGYSTKTLRTYQAGLASLTAWIAATHPELAPAELDRHHVRGWIADVRQRNGATTAATYFAGVRHFARWLVSEGEATSDATDRVKYPATSEPATPVLSTEDLKRLLETCAKQTFTGRRDAAIIMVLADGGLRLAELAELRLVDVDLPGRILYVAGKGTARRGPRRRAVAPCRSASARRRRSTATCASGSGIRSRTRRPCGWAPPAGPR